MERGMSGNATRGLGGVSQQNDEEQAGFLGDRTNNNTTTTPQTSRWRLSLSFIGIIFLLSLAGFAMKGSLKHPEIAELDDDDDKVEPLNNLWETKAEDGDVPSLNVEEEEKDAPLGNLWETENEEGDEPSLDDEAPIKDTEDIELDDEDNNQGFDDNEPELNVDNYSKPDEDDPSGFDDGSRDSDADPFPSYSDGGSDNSDKDDDDDTIEEEPEASNVTLRCIPKACMVPKHFFSATDARKFPRGKPFIMLASYPGSGNTWLRSIIEAGTRVWTGAVYHRDDELFQGGFLGEGLNPFSRSFPTMSAIKTHWPFYVRELSPRTKAVVHIIRSPFNALLAELERQLGQGHTNSVPAEQLRFHLNKFLETRRASWMKSCHLYAGQNFWKSNEFTTIRTERGVTGFRGDRPVFQHNVLQTIKNNVTIPVITLLYEDFVADLEGTTRLLFSFLKEWFGDTMPEVEDAVQCALAAGQAQQQMHRVPNGTIDYNPYTDPAGYVMRNGNLKKSCEVFKDCWLEEKWGPCKAAMRKVPRPRTSSQPFGNNYCET